MMAVQKQLDAGLWEVTFRRRTTNGETQAAVVGDFNAWSPVDHHMTRVGDAWNLTVPLAPGRSYRFRYLIDGDRWENDWDADDYVDNAYGGQDSVVDLKFAHGCREHEPPGQQSRTQRPVAAG